MILQGSLLLIIFLIFAYLMMSRKMPALLALPAMALAVAFVSGIFFDWTQAVEGEPQTLAEFIMDTVLTKGPARLAAPMMYAIFGAILSQVVMRSGIAARIISIAAEYAGEHKMRLAFLMTFVTACCFSSVTGLGAVIMIGSLVLPILIGAGISASFAAGLMLFAISIGGIFNPSILGFYMDTLGLSQELVQKYVLAYGIFLSLTTIAYLIIGGMRERSKFAWAEPVSVPETKKMPFIALLTPIIPIALIMIFGMPIIPAFLIGMIWGVVTTDVRRALANLTAAFLEGLKDVSPVLGLFMGIGMALNAMMAAPAKAVMAPFLEAVVPSSPIPFVIFFTVFAPLALYRGPFNFYGLGAGVAGILLGAGILPASAIMAAFFSVGQMQSVCDPTNTHNVWLAQFTKTGTEKLLKDTIPYVWAFALVCLVWSVFFAGALQ